MLYRVIGHPDVADRDLKPLNQDVQERVLRALETRLATAPERYGVPLRRELRRYWKLRVGDYRIVCRIVGEEVWVFGIGNRKDIYRWIKTRTGWNPQP